MGADAAALRFPSPSDPLLRSGPPRAFSPRGSLFSPPSSHPLLDKGGPGEPLSHPLSLLDVPGPKAFFSRCVSLVTSLPVFCGHPLCVSAFPGHSSHYGIL